LAEYLDNYVSEVTDFIPSEELRGIDKKAANVDVSRGASGQKENPAPKGKTNRSNNTWGGRARKVPDGIKR